ncbi:MAG: glycine oxidase ThiO, partial [Candidatus Methylomirabilales bacterium]
LAPQAEALAPGPFLDLCLKSREMFGPLGDLLKAETGIDIEYLCSGLLYLVFTEEDEIHAKRMLEEQRGCGLRVEWWDRRQVLKAEPHVSPEIRGALHLPDDHHVQNARMVRAQSLLAARRGVEVVEGSPVTGVVREGDRVIGVHTPTQTYHGDKIVIAAGAWSGVIGEFLDREIPIQPARGQLLSLEMRPDLFRHILYARQAYLVPRANGEVVVGSTVEFVGFEKQVTAAGIAGLLTAARELVPGLADRPFVRAWSGFRPWTPDELPYLGHVPGTRGLYVASGHFRNGILLAPVTGHLMAERLLDQKPSFSLDPFGLDR